MKAKDNLFNCREGLFIKAVECGVKGLMYRQLYDVNLEQVTRPLIESHSSAINCLNEAIGLGGSNNHLPDSVMPYWMIQYRPGIRISLFKNIDGKIVEDKVGKNLVLKIAKRIFKEKRNPQLSLF